MKDEEQSVFVSRHGRRTNVENVDLGKIDVEHETPYTESSKKPAQSSKKSKTSVPVAVEPRRIKLPRGPRPSMSRTKVIAVAAVLCLLIVLPLLALEAVALQYRSAANGLKSDAARIGKDIALPEQKKATLSPDAIQKTITELSKARDKACRGGMLDNIANVYPRSKTAREQCAVQNGEISQLIVGLATLKNLQAYGASVDTILKPALAASDSPYAVIPDQVAAWQEATKKLAAVSPPEDTKAFHSSLRQVAGDIEKQWSGINTAHNNQDLDGFKEAETKLASFYESLRELAPSLTSVQDTAQSQVSRSAANLSGN